MLVFVEVLSSGCLGSPLGLGGGSTGLSGGCIGLCGSYSGCVGSGPLGLGVVLLVFD